MLIKDTQSSYPIRLIALMLGRLRMSVKDSIEAYGQLAKEVFSQGSDKKLKTSKLEKAIKQIVDTYSAPHDPEDKLEDIRDNACKTCVHNILPLTG
jgi:hypothetical protein